MNQYFENDDGVHLLGPLGDYMICGDSMDAHVYSDVDEMVEVPQQNLTCERCLDVLELCAAHSARF